MFFEPLDSVSAVHPIPIPMRAASAPELSITFPTKSSIKENNAILLNSCILSNSPPLINRQVIGQFRYDKFHKTLRKNRELKVLKTRDIATYTELPLPNSPPKTPLSIRAHSFDSVRSLYLPSPSITPIPRSPVQLTPPPDSPILRQLIDTITPKKTSSSIMTRKAHHEAHNKSLAAYCGRQIRVNRYFSTIKKEARYNVFSKRGIYVCGMRNQKTNLGNFLNITEAYMRDLDMDRNQTLFVPAAIEISDIPGNFEFHTTRYKQNTLVSTPYQHFAYPLLTNGQHILTAQFNKLKLECDIHTLLVDGFTMITLLHEKKVVAVILYVVMRRYVWIESVAVSEEWTGQGIGRAFLDRVCRGAESRGKQVMLFAINGVEEFYEKLGFEQSDRFATKEYLMGKFLKWG